MKKYQAYIKVNLTVTPEVMATSEAEAREMFDQLSVENLLTHISDVSTVDICSIYEVKS